MLQVQDVRLDPLARRLWRAGREVHLARMEFDLVAFLLARAGTIVTRDELMREVWRTTYWSGTKTIDVHLGWVRRKLGDDTQNPVLIRTYRGKGLCFETQPGRAS